MQGLTSPLVKVRIPGCSFARPSVLILAELVRQFDCCSSLVKLFAHRSQRRVPLIRSCFTFVTRGITAFAGSLCGLAETGNQCQRYHTGWHRNRYAIAD